MPSFPLLDIAIGLAFVFLLLSLVSSSLSEGLESLLRNRANDLEAGIRKLLGDEGASWWASFLPWVNSVKAATITREFYSHPLIRNLYRAETRLPTYIPTRNFALAILDLVGKDGSLVRGATSHPTTVDPTALSLAAKVGEISLPASLTGSVKTLIIAANGDIQQARINVENWFNSSMDRVSGGYKSRTQKILFCIGVVVTIFVNADSVMIYRNLSQSKNLQAIVTAAQGTASQTPAAGGQQQIQDALAQLNALDIGVGWVREGNQAGAVDEGKLPPWGNGSCKTQMGPCTDPVGWCFHLLYLHAVGWMITAAAISLGAPFWFDTLNRFIVVRSTVKPSEKSATEGSKDPGK